MTGFFALLRDDCAFVSMDTLATNSVTKEPNNLVNKILSLVSCRSIFCCVGNLDFCMELYKFIQLSILCNDFDTLKKYLVPLLPQFVKQYKDKNGVDVEETTIYIIGQSRFSGKYDGFKIEVDKTPVIQDLQHGFIARPCDGIIDPVTSDVLLKITDEDDFEKLFVKAIETMKNENDKKPDGLHIGGQIQVAIMKDNSVHIDYFEPSSFEETYSKAVLNLRKNQGSS